MRTKKWLAILLTGIVVCSMTGCSLQNQTTQQTAQEESDTKQAQDTKLSQDEELADGIDLSDFQVTDLNGNTVTQEIFQDYDVTMINIWATWCGPCRSELPEIQAAYEQLPENANIISICHDGAEEAEVANAIVEKTGLEFEILVPDEKMNETVFSHIAAFPTTIFVDSEGQLVGDIQIGVPAFGDVTQVYLDLINNCLK